MGNQEPVVSRLCKWLQDLPPQELLHLGLHGENFLCFHQEISSGQILSISKYSAIVFVEFCISRENSQQHCSFVEGSCMSRNP